MSNEHSNGNSDFMYRSSILRQHGQARTYFDPANKLHCASLKVYLETGSWGDVQFFPEYPYTDVPTTVLAKFAKFRLKASPKVKHENPKVSVEGPATPV